MTTISNLNAVLPVSILIISVVAKLWLDFANNDFGTSTCKRVQQRTVS